MVGCFDKLKCPAFPSTPHPLSVFAALTGGQGKVMMGLVVSRLDTDEEIASHQKLVTFPDKLAEVYYHMRFKELSFPAPTTYEFTLLASGQWLAQRRLRVE